MNVDYEGMLLGVPTVLGGGGGVVYLLRDLFTTPLAAGAVDGTNADGTGIREVTADSGSNLSIADDQLQITAVVGNTDPASYWTRNDGSGLTRDDGLALIAYHQNGAWVGWSNSTALATSSLLYGAKGRAAYAAGSEFTDALPTGDPVHIIVLCATGAQHIVRVGTDDYLAFTYPLGSDAALYPALLGDVCQLEALYAYKVTPATPTAVLSSHAQGTEFIHPTGAFLLEFDIVTLGTGADSIIVLREQDSNNRLELYLTAGRRLVLNQRIAGSQTLLSNLGAAGALLNGSRVIIQFQPPSIFVTAAGSNGVKAWTLQPSGTVDPRATSTTPPFSASTLGRLQSLSSGTVLANLKTWSIPL